MELICNRCKATFDSALARGYCDSCVEHFRDVRKGVNRKQNPAPGICADGKFTDEACPSSFEDGVSGRQVCGLCGSDELEPGYGLGTGYGMGSYTFCCGCNTFLDFREDVE